MSKPYWVGSFIALFTAVWLAVIAADTTPAGGTLTATSGPQTFKAGPFTPNNANTTAQVELMCAPAANRPDRCDDYILTLQVAPTYRDTHPNGALQVTLRWDTTGPNSAADFDLYLITGSSGAGTEKGSSGNSTDPTAAENGELMQVPLTALADGSYRVRIVPYTGANVQEVRGTVELVDLQAEPEGPCVTSIFDASSTSTGVAVPARLGTQLKSAEPGKLFGAYVYFASGTRAQQDALIQRAGLHIKQDFRRYSTGVFVTGPASALLSMLREPGVRRLAENKPMRYFNDTGPWSTRARVTQERVSGGPYFAPDGVTPLLGQGQTVVIADSGLNALQGDFAGRLHHNYKPVGDPIFTATTDYVDAGMTNTDTTSGHGTHVVGTAVGSGAMSTATYPVPAAAPNVKGTFAGGAPAAMITVYSVGEVAEPVGVAPVAALLYIDTALNHLLENHKAPEYTNAPVRVVSLSLGDGGGTPYNPSDVTSCLNKALVAEQINVVWAAGNDAGDGSADMTSSTCKDPTPGVICVASLDDVGSGRIDSSLSSFSGRGLLSNPKEYPDITAPGSDITSTCIQGVQGQITCTTGAETRWQPGHGTISGTSMATPLVSGMIALLRQAKPDLTPAQVEKVLQDTARKVNTNGAYVDDPQNPGGTTNFGFGGGLVDLPAALDALGVRSAGLVDVNQEVLILDGDADTGIAGAGNITKMTMQNAEAGGVRGIQYRLTLADATAFGAASAFIYTVEQNVNGRALPVKVRATPAATSAEGGFTGPVTRSGNVVSFFVPIVSLQSPPLGAPIHNIRVVVTDGNGAAVDFAPSPASLPADAAATRPAYGQPFSVQVEDVAVPEDICTAPGKTLLVDATGDFFVAANENSPAAFDIHKLSVVQPLASAESDYKIELRLKMDRFDPIPVGTWPLSFCSPRFPCINPDVNTAAYGATNKYYTVRMTTDSSVAPGASPAAPVFQILQPTEAGTTTGSRTTKVITGQGSTAAADGLIRFVLLGTDIGLTGAAAGTEMLSKFHVRVTPGATTPDNMPDGLAGEGEYATKTLGFCGTNTAPVAALAASRLRGPSALTVSFAPSAVDAEQHAIFKYELDFGDGTPVKITGSNSAITHRYNSQGVYTAQLFATDERLARSAVVQRVITVGPPNRAPQAALVAASAVSGAHPLTVQFNAASSSDPDDGDEIAQYLFDFGDGSPVLTRSSPLVTYTYPTPRATPYSASVIVKDLAGVSSAGSAPVAVTVTNTAPIASLGVDRSEAAHSEPFGFNLSGQDGENDALSYTLDFGDGSAAATGALGGSPTAVNHRYSLPGSYTASLTVTDVYGAVSSAVQQVVTATNLPPLAQLDANVAEGLAPLTLSFEAVRSVDPDEGDRIVRYALDYGDGSALAVQEPAMQELQTFQHTYASPGAYTARLTVTDLVGGTHSAEQIIQVSQPGAPVAALTLDPVRLLINQELHLDASGSADPDERFGDSVASYHFDFGDGTTLVNQSSVLDDLAPYAVHRYARIGIYTVALTVRDENGNDSVPVSRQIQVTSTPPVAALVADVTSGTPPQLVRFSAAESRDPDGDRIVRYQFDFGDGSAPVETDSVNPYVGHQYTAAGRYLATLIVTDSNGDLSAPATLNIQINAVSQPVASASDDNPHGSSLGWLLLLPLGAVAFRRRVRA